MEKAEEIVKENDLYKIAIISGVGVRQYYEKKHGYHLDKDYMIKNLVNHDYKYELIIILTIFTLLFSILYDLL